MESNQSIEFNYKETMLMFDQELFPLKRLIIEKLFILFQSTIEQLKDTSIHKQFNFLPNTDVQFGKITRGENHLQFPYVVLDFPKQFDQNDIFCFRNMFWFGHFFSSSLILTGKHLHNFQDQFLKNKNALIDHEIYFSLHHDPWQNHVEKPTSVLVETLSESQILEHIEKYKFIKLTNCFVENDFAKIIEQICKNYTLLLNALSGSSNSFR